MSQLPSGAVLALMGLLFARTMAWTSSGKTHAELVNNLYKKGIIKSQRVFDVLLATDRGHYIKYFPYMDSPQSIGYKATISAPHMHAHALELLKDQLVEGAKALDVGSGSGYLTACFARMIGPTGKAVGVEHIKELVHESIRNVQEDDPTLLSSGRVKLVVGDGRQGYPEEAPYDAIHVGAAAATVPKEVFLALLPGMSPAAEGAEAGWAADRARGARGRQPGADAVRQDQRRAHRGDTAHGRHLRPPHRQGKAVASG
ncbi:protein-L-isoaspartate(D-aspartate) O-methyltransferase-like isoform X2 [Sylvia atricapilla]|uniref:protein-L-isoaspartate(D-aspartate) O-methyltransferase-like isoform X2 n=1 Tax=Sylvia atricapilla TaxID=48155 RepID=UPI003397E321